MTILTSNSSVLKKEAENSSETVLRFYQTTRHHIPEYSNFDSHLTSPFLYFFVFSLFLKFAAMILCRKLVAGGLNFSTSLRLFPGAVSRRISPRKERLFVQNKRCRIAPTRQFVLGNGRKRVPCGADWREKVTLSEQ